MPSRKKPPSRSAKVKSRKSPAAKFPRAGAAPYATETFVPKEAIGYLITRTKTALWERADEILAPLDLTLSQWVIIANLVNSTMTTPAEICKALSYDPGAMTRLLDRLEKKGFIRRVRHVSDRRSVTLELTRAGRDLYPTLLKRIVAGYNDILTGFKATEVRQLESMLKRLLVNLGAAHGAPASKEKTS